MNGKLVQMETMRCRACDATARYNALDNVSFTDAWRTFQVRCVCEE